MIDYQAARQLALDYIGPECGLVESATIEKPYGWYFFGQSRAYLASGDFRDMLVGSNGFIVEREKGRIVEFGSTYPSEVWIAHYERGFKYSSYNLTITSVKDENRTVDLLDLLDMSYVVAEVAYGVEWRIPQRRTEQQIRDALRILPCLFEKLGILPGQVYVFDAIDQSGCCTYELTEHHEEQSYPHCDVNSDA